MSVADWYFAGNDPVAVNAVLSGSGYAELVLEYTIHTPLIEPGGKPPSGRDDMDVHSTLVRETIWAGVLEEQPQTIGGWIVSPLSRLPDGTDRLQRGARMVFRLRDGDRLRVHEWSASQVEFPEQRARKDLVDATVAGGVVVLGEQRQCEQADRVAPQDQCRWSTASVLAFPHHRGSEDNNATRVSRDAVLLGTGCSPGRTRS